MIIKNDQIFNLMDTNGRRSDVTNALQGYLTILDDIQNVKKMKWASLPESLAQYEFYRQAIELSPDVFVKHSNYDDLIRELKEKKEFKRAVDNLDIEWINDNSLSYKTLIEKFDKGIEDRARHYTSNLVKLGFTDENREISPNGKLLLDLNKLNKDELETMLPIDGVNIVYLRQLLKLRIFNANKTRSYSPFCLAIYALLKKNRIVEKEFLELVQGLNPCSEIDDLANYVLNYKEGAIVEGKKIEVPDEIKNCSKISKDTFKKYFTNRKSSDLADIYWNYYDRLLKHISSPSPDTVKNLLSYYEDNKATLNKAFNCGQDIFSPKEGERPALQEFQNEYNQLFNSDINSFLYKQFTLSKIIDQIREYSDTTKRIFNASGIIRFANGNVELEYSELCSCIFNEEDIKARVFCSFTDSADYTTYEDGPKSYFCNVTSLLQILEYNQNNIETVKIDIQNKFGRINIEEIPEYVANIRRDKFNQFIEKNYPIDKVKSILSLFCDRSKDYRVKELVCPDASVPTIYEYIVGIGWYYFSGKSIDLLSSFNLTMSANFDPLVHAGGGQGDIVIYDFDKVVMLEATLMNASSQKRGEWEPVLRHSINLKAKEETANTGREVTTFFVADEFDLNTINIWKAIASVPLQSSVDKKITDNVVIMPINTKELCQLMDKSEEYNDIIKKVHILFDPGKNSFDIDWRTKFMSDIM